jgi:hypothetical protein
MRQFGLLCSITGRQDSVVCIATCYTLDGPEILSWWGVEIFRAHPDRLWGPPSLLYNGYRALLGDREARAWHWPPTPSSVGVKERVEQYLYSTSGPLWPLLGWTLPMFDYKLVLPECRVNSVRFVGLETCCCLSKWIWRYLVSFCLACSFSWALMMSAGQIIIEHISSMRYLGTIQLEFSVCMKEQFLRCALMLHCGLIMSNIWILQSR